MTGLVVVRRVVLHEHADHARHRAGHIDLAHAQERHALEAHAAAFNLAIFFFSLGATVFSYLLFVSRYIPRGLAGLGVVGSVMVFVGTGLHFAAPVYDAMFAGLYWIPVAVFEVATGVWLLVFGAKIGDLPFG